MEFGSLPAEFKVHRVPHDDGTAYVFGLTEDSLWQCVDPPNLSPQCMQSLTHTPPIALRAISDGVQGDKKGLLDKVAEF